MEHNQQGGRGRRSGFHQRGRRGPDRRPQGRQESRAPQPSEPQTPRVEHVDVEQIMREIRARIAQRHGIDLSAQQIQELAARRLEAVLDPRNVNPSLLEELRKAAGGRPLSEVTPNQAAPLYSFEDTTLYDSHRGLLRAIRRLLNPLLRLFFNPNTVVHALNAQTRLNAEQAARETEREQRQSEWNALHYELLRRVVAESAKASIELQALTMRVQSLATRVDFADRRVRTLEAAPAPRHIGRPPQESHPAPATAAPAVATERPADAGGPVPSAPVESGQETQRKRRRRRRGRRSGGSLAEGFQPQPGSPAMANDRSAEEFDDGPDDAPDAVEDGEPEAPPQVLQDSVSSQSDEPAQTASVTADQAVFSAPVEAAVPTDDDDPPESRS